MNELTPNLSYVDGNGMRIYPNSILFKAGKYPDKEIEVTPEELAAAVAGFKPLYLNVEHASHGAHEALKGMFGEVRSSWVDPEDASIARCEVAIPVQLDDKLKSRGLSAEIDFEQKQFCGCGITYTPRVSEAVMMSTFSEMTGKPASFFYPSEIEQSGKYPSQDKKKAVRSLQSLHDMAVSSGAECPGVSLFSAENKAEHARRRAEFVGTDELKALQHHHDHAADNGASCDEYATRQNMWRFSVFAAFAGSRHSAGDAADIQTAHDLMVKQGATCKAEMSSEQSRSTDPPGKGKKGRPMNWDDVVAFIRGDKPNAETETPQAGAAGFSSADFAALKAEVATIKAERDALSARFAEQETAKKDEGKALNLALFAEDKAKLPGADAIFDALSGEALTLHLENVKAEHARRFPANARQTVPTQVSNFARDVEGGAPAGADEEAKINELLALTPNGRQALKNGKGGN